MKTCTSHILYRKILYDHRFSKIHLVQDKHSPHIIYHLFQMQITHLGRTLHEAVLTIGRHGKLEINPPRESPPRKKAQHLQTLSGKKVECGYSPQLSSKLANKSQPLLCQSTWTMDYQVLSYGLEEKRQMTLVCCVIWTHALP